MMRLLALVPFELFCGSRCPDRAQTLLARYHNCIPEGHLEEVFMKQPEGFVEKGKEPLVCILKLAQKFDAKNLGELHYFLSVQVTKKNIKMAMSGMANGIYSQKVWNE